MHFSIQDLDINFQLAMFAAVLEREPGLVAVREQESGRLLYINEAGMAMLGTKDHAVLQELLDQHQLGSCGSFTEGSLPPEERQWTNLAGKSFTGLYEAIPFRHDKKTTALSELPLLLLVTATASS